MQDTRFSGRVGLVELLATWELTSLPGVSSLFCAMSGFRGLDELALLARVADSPGIALVPGLLEDVRGVLRKARDRSSIEPEFRRRVSEIVHKSSEALASYVDEQLGTLQRDLKECVAGLSRSDRERVFQPLWRSSGSGTDDRLAQVHAIDEARELLDRARTEMDSPVNGPAGQHAPEDDPTMAAEAAKRLEETLASGEKLLTGVADTPTFARELLEALLTDARAALQQSSLVPSLLVEQTETLTVLMQGIQSDRFAVAFAPPTHADNGKDETVHGKDRTKLRSAIVATSETLARYATVLPTADVLRFRTRLDEAELATHDSDREALRRQIDELKQDADAMRRLADQQKGYEDDRNAAEAQRLTAEIEKLAKVAQGGDAKRLAALKADLAQPKKRARVARALSGLATRISSRQRLRLATLLHRATRCAEKARALMRAEIEDAETAVSAESLPAVVEATVALDRALRQAAPWRGPRGWIAAAVLITAVLVGSGLGWRALHNGRTSVSFEFEMAADVGDVKFELFRLGESVEAWTVSPGESVEADLEAGRFEIFVNDRYTGRVVQIPQDAGSIDPIVVPQ